MLRLFFLVFLTVFLLLASMTGCGDDDGDTGSTGSTGVVATATPLIAVTSGEFLAPFTVAITCPDTNAVVRFTTNGSDPTTNSATYASPVSVPTSLTLKAIAVAPGKNPSAIASATYTRRTLAFAWTETDQRNWGFYRNGSLATNWSDAFYQAAELRAIHNNTTNVYIAGAYGSQAGIYWINGTETKLTGFPAGNSRFVRDIYDDGTHRYLCGSYYSTYTKPYAEIDGVRTNLPMPAGVNTGAAYAVTRLNNSPLVLGYMITNSESRFVAWTDGALSWTSPLPVWEYDISYCESGGESYYVCVVYTNGKAWPAYCHNGTLTTFDAGYDDGCKIVGTRVIGGDIYAFGNVYLSGAEKACYWKNWQIQIVGTGADATKAHDLEVVSGTVVVAGLLYDDDSGFNYPAHWIGTNQTVLSNLGPGWFFGVYKE